MKRAFLFGLGSFLIIVAISELARLNKIDAILALVCMPVSVVVIRAANRAPPNRSRLHAVFGWLLGFLVINAVVLVGAAVIYVITKRD
jgi:hypothetical protein